jgi:ribosome maturation factor RimP
MVRACQTSLAVGGIQADPNPGPAFFLSSARTRLAKMTEPLTNPVPQLDRPRLAALVGPIALAHGGEVWDIEWKPESDGWVLRIYVEKAGADAKRLSTKDAAVDLELCANVARDLSAALDADDFMPHAYNLEVSSPGIERALKKPEDFARFVGDKAKLWLKKPALPRGKDTGNGQRVVEGRLVSFEKNVIVVLDGSRSFDLAFDDVERARLVFELTTGKKQEKGKKPKGEHAAHAAHAKKNINETKSGPSPQKTHGANSSDH